MQVCKKNYFTIIISFFLCSILFCKAYPQDAPSIIKLLPDHAVPGDTIFIIMGKGFMSDGNKVNVFFGDKIAKIVASSEKSIAVKVPEGIKNCEVVVEINGIKSNFVSFKVNTDEEGKTKTPKIKIQLTVSDPVADVGKVITGAFRVVGTEKPIEISFQNQSPDVISIEGGNNQTVITSGGTENIYSFKIKALTGPRKYTISYNWKIHEHQMMTTKYIWEEIDLNKKPSMKK